MRAKPDFPVALEHLARTHQVQGQLQSAKVTYERLLALQPNRIDLYGSLGFLYQETGQYEQAINHYLKALDHHSQDLLVLSNLAVLYQYFGEYEKATHYYRLAYEIRPSDLLKLKIVTLLPQIYQSQEELLEYYKIFQQELQQLLEQELSFGDVLKEGAVTSFYVHYMGFDDYSPQVKLADIYRKACPDLESNLVTVQPTLNSGRIKIGFVSRHFYNHTTSHFIQGVIEHLNKEQFELYIFSLVDHPDDFTQIYKDNAHKFIELPHDLKQSRQLIAREQLDILFYPNLGMDADTYFLAFSRLAPIQCTTWGHGQTSGIPNMDYFFSDRYLEGVSPQERYSEQLILMDALLPYYYRLPPPIPLKPRSDFGLSETDHLYICPHNIFKFHPEFDEVLLAILKRDPKGKLLLLIGNKPQLCQQIKQRFSQTLTPVLHQIVWLPPQPTKDFMNLIALSEVMLSPLHLSGGATSLDGFSTGTPIVALPTEFAKGRVPAMLYQHMGINECIVNSKAEYIELAVKLGTDIQYRSEISRKILNNLDKIYENTAGVRELELKLSELVKHYPSGVNT